MIAVVVSNVTSNSFQYACHIGPLVGPRSSLCFRFTKRTPDVVEIFEEQLQIHHVLNMFCTCQRFWVLTSVDCWNIICRLRVRFIRLFSIVTIAWFFPWRCITRSASMSCWRRVAISLVCRALPMPLAKVGTVMFMELCLGVIFSIPC